MKNLFRKKEKKEEIKIDALKELIDEGYDELKDISVIDIKENTIYRTYYYIYKEGYDEFSFMPVGEHNNILIYSCEELKLYIFDNYEFFKNKEKEKYLSIKRKLLKKL